MRVQLPSGKTVDVPDEMQGQAALDYLDEQERRITPPGAGSRFMAGVYEGMGRQGEMATNVLERFGLNDAAASTMDFSNAMMAHPSVEQNLQHPAGVGGSLANMGGRLFSDLPMIMGAMGAARGVGGVAEALSGRALLPQAGQTFLQQYPRVIGEAAVGGGMLEAAAARPGVENPLTQGMKGAGEWAAGAAILHPAFKTLGWAASKLLGKFKGDPAMTPEKAATDPNLPMVLDSLQQGKSEADIIIDLTKKEGTWGLPGGAPAEGQKLLPAPAKGLPEPTPADYMRAASEEPYTVGAGGQGEMRLPIRRRGRQDVPITTDVAGPIGPEAGTQLELPGMGTRDFRSRRGQGEMILPSRGTLPVDGESSVIYSPKEKRFVNKGQTSLPGLDTSTGRLPGTERTQLPTGVREPAPPPMEPGAPMETQHGLTMQYPSEINKSTVLQPVEAYEGMKFKVGQSVKYAGKARKITGFDGQQYVLDGNIKVLPRDIKSAGGRRGKKTEDASVPPATQEGIPPLTDQEVALRYGLEHPEKAEELKALMGSGKDLSENQFIREAYQMAIREPGMMKSMKNLLGDDEVLGPLIKKAMGEGTEVTKPQGPFEKAPPPNDVEQIEVPVKIVNEIRALGYDDTFIANLFADNGVVGAEIFIAGKKAALAAKGAKRQEQLALSEQKGGQKRLVRDEDLDPIEGDELDPSVKDDLISLVDAMDDAETRAIAEGRAISDAEEQEILDAAIQSGIAPVQRAAADVSGKPKTVGQALIDRLKMMKAKGVVETEPVTITKTGKVRSKPKDTESTDEELLRLMDEQKQDMMGRDKGFGPDKEGWGEEGGAATKLLAVLSGIGATGVLGSYAYYKLRDFVEEQNKRADELRKQLGSAELPEPQVAGLSGAGLSALKEAIMVALEKTSLFARSSNQTLEGGQEVLWKKDRAQINPMSEWFVDPARIADKLGKDVSDWWSSLMKADNISGYNYKNHATLFRDVEGTLTKEERLRMRDILDGTLDAKSDAEKQAYGKIREFYDEMWIKVQDSRKKVYEQNLTEEEFGAFKKVFDEGVPEEAVLKDMPKEQSEVMREIFQDFRDLKDKGRIEDYVTKHELGQYHLVEEVMTTDGKMSRRIIANAVSKKDAVRKAKKYFEENPDKRSLTIDSNGLLYDLGTTLPRGSYYRIMGDLRKALKKDISWIEEELGRSVGNKGDMARRAVRRAFTLKPSEKFSPYLQERKDVLKGEENIFDVLPSYAMSIEKKTNLDPVIAQARKLMGTIDDPGGRQWMANLVEDVKGRYWASDRIVDNLMKKMNADVRPMGFSRGVAKIKQGEAMLKLGYRPIASLINRLSGEGHTWVKFGTETFMEAKRYMGTAEGKAFLKTVDPYMGVSYATDASGRIKPQESMLHPLGLFQKAELPNRETALTAAFLHAQKNLGMNEVAAREYAIRQNWFTQFTYNAASLPRILRTPTGRLLGQFKPYLLKEIEFVKQLSGQELARYIGFQIAMGGPRGLVMVLKSLPILGSLAALDDVELWMNKNMPRSSRGLVGGALGMDITAAATMQLPTKFDDWTGPFISDIMNIKKNALDPLMKGEGGVTKGLWKSAESMAPIARYWPELLIDRIFTPGQKDYIIKDDRGRELYRLDWPDYIKEAAGAEPLESARVRTAEGILSRRRTAEGKQKTHVIDTFVKALENGNEIPPELFNEMMTHHVTPASIRREMRFRKLPPGIRQALRTELQKRSEVAGNFPVLGE
jgi:hypothetical protein